jgi:NAD(P)-dependent dehydrogenase (short-subunit alcohol dehydrogenase family)
VRLSEKKIVITGAAGLLGVEHALAVLGEGGEVALLDINLDRLESFKKSCSPEQQDRIHYFDCDITNENQLREISKKICRDMGPPTGLVNNAAINPAVEAGTGNFTRLENLSVESWNLELGVGLTGAMLCSKIFGILMVENHIAGSLVHIASDHGIMAPNQDLYRLEGVDPRNQPVKPVTYSVVKHGLIGLSRYLSTYWSNYGIRSNSICPGGVRNAQNQNFLDKFNKLVPLGRPAEPEEYRGALVFLLSDESSYMTGSNLVIDGGRSVW